MASQELPVRVVAASCLESLLERGHEDEEAAAAGKGRVNAKGGAPFEMALKLEVFRGFWSISLNKYVFKHVFPW